MSPKQLDTRLYFHRTAPKVRRVTFRSPPTGSPRRQYVLSYYEVGRFQTVREHSRALTPKRRFQLVGYKRRIQQPKTTTAWLSNASGQYEYTTLPGRRGWPMILECRLTLPKAWVITLTAKS